MNGSETAEFTLRVGESAKLRTGIFSPTIKVIFAGMPSESSYSIVVSSTMGNNSLAYNLYFTDRQLELALPKGKMKIITVSRENITFKYQS